LKYRDYFVEVDYIFTSSPDCGLGGSSTGEIYSVNITLLNPETDNEEKTFTFKEGMENYESERIAEFLRLSEWFNSSSSYNRVWCRNKIDALSINKLGMKLIYFTLFNPHSLYCYRTLSEFLARKDVPKIEYECSTDHLRRILLFLDRMK